MNRGAVFVPAPNPGSAFPNFSRAGAAATRIPADGRNEAAASRTESQATEWPDTPGPGLNGASPFEGSRRSIDDLAPSPDEPGGAAPQADGPVAPPPRPAIDRSDRHPAVRQTPRRASRSHDMQHPVGSTPSQEERSGETRPPARQEWPEIGQTGSPLDARASDVPARAENGQARGAGESDVPPHGSRLTGSTESLAAMLRSHVAQPELVIPEPVIRAAEKESKDVFSSRQGDDERGTADEPARTRPADLAGVEEVMERLADELETEFVRTYGRSGG